MGRDVPLIAATIENLVIALAYLGIGAYVAPKFTLGTSSNLAARVTKWCGIVFFVSCAMTHLELAYHAQPPEDFAAYTIGEWLSSWHGQVIHGLQAASGVVFLVLAVGNLSIRIYSKNFYEEMLDEYTRELEAVAPPVSRVDLHNPEHANWIAMLKDAIERDAMKMVYQPIVNIKTQKVVGFEALARFRSYPDTNPEQWFVAASRFGLAKELELQAVRLALADSENLPGATYLTLNVSQETFLSNELVDLLVDRGPRTHRYVLELTEHIATVRYKPLLDASSLLHYMGVKIGVDDVGSGFASMRRVIELKPEILKVDRTLSINVVTDEHQQALVRALVNYAKEVGVSVVVEGVETKAQVDVLTSLGVRFGQGYYFGRPESLPVK